MIVLHPFSSKEWKRKRETWEFTDSLKRAGYVVLDRKIDAPMDYPNVVKELWTTDDMIVLEDDKVPTMRDFDELAGCKYAYCCFPYPINFRFRTTMKTWTDPFPYTLGFVKFSQVVQKNVPASVWYLEGEHWGLDRMIERPMIERFGPFHIHSRFIKHNHPAGLYPKLRNLGARVLGVRK